MGEIKKKIELRGLKIIFLFKDEIATQTYSCGSYVVDRTVRYCLPISNPLDFMYTRFSVSGGIGPLLKGERCGGPHGPHGVISPRRK